MDDQRAFMTDDGLGLVLLIAAPKSPADEIRLSAIGKTWQSKQAAIYF